MKKSVIGLTVLSTLLPLSMAASAFADVNPAQQLQRFEKTYQFNLAEENGLLAKAQSGQSTNSETAELSQTVTLLNQTSANFYSSLQALVNNRSSLPQYQKTSESSGSEAARQHIENRIREINRELAHMKKGKDGWRQREKMIRNRTGLESSMRLLQRKMPPSQPESWKNHPYDGSVPSLEKTILSLQQSAVHYTKLWISINDNSSSTVTGSVYGQNGGN